MYNTKVDLSVRVKNLELNVIFSAENLRVRRDPLGENGPTMEVTWDHPATKQPENGYKLVFAPFKDIVDQKPWSVNVAGDQASVSVHVQVEIMIAFDVN